MIRREARLRREYLYRKSLETQRKETYDKKQLLKESLNEGTRLRTEMKNTSAELLDDLVFDSAQVAPTTHNDDEYSNSGIKDPKILITTSRDPSSRLQQFAKEMRLVFPNSQRMNRGNYVMKDIVQACKSNDITDLVILHEHRGVPDHMVVCHFPYGPTAFFSLNNVVLRHDLPDQGTISEAYPHLIFDKFQSALGKRVESILKHLFPVPKEESKRIMTFSNENDFISFRHHVYDKISYKEVELEEVGPRFEMKLYEIRLATVDIEEADKEWVFRPFMNSSKKKEFL